MRGEDTVARMGGGAFAVLAHGEDADADRLAARCLSVVEQPIVTTAGMVELTAGVGLVPLEAGSASRTCSPAPTWPSAAAHDAGAGLAPRATAPPLGEAAARRDRLRPRPAGRLRPATSCSCCSSPSSPSREQRITGLEAQLRWRHPELGEIPPAEFLAARRAQPA